MGSSMVDTVMAVIGLSVAFGGLGWLLVHEIIDGPQSELQQQGDMAERFGRWVQAKGWTLSTDDSSQLRTRWRLPFTELDKIVVAAEGTHRGRDAAVVLAQSTYGEFDVQTSAYLLTLPTSHPMVTVVDRVLPWFRPSQRHDLLRRFKVIGNRDQATDVLTEPMCLLLERDRRRGKIGSFERLQVGGRRLTLVRDGWPVIVHVDQYFDELIDALGTGTATTGALET